MKNTFYTIVLLAFVALIYSCSKSPEKMIIGTWTLDSVEVLNIDEVTNYYLKTVINSLDEKILTADQKLKELDPKDKKNAEDIAQLETQKKELESQKASNTFEVNKKKLLDTYAKMNGLTFIFNEDKTYLYKTPQYEEKGTWKMAEDGKSVLIISGIDDFIMNLLIQELSDNKMSIKYEYKSEAEVTEDVVYYFSK